MKVSVVYAGSRQVLLPCAVDDGATVKQVLEKSGILKCCPDIDLKTQKVGIFGKFVKLDSAVSEGDRIEIYRKITRVLDEEDDDDD
jgi:putative ubiquitin-RnfH superfamily antitoxin RatB of RatAB toxin-antitoxin module